MVGLNPAAVSGLVKWISAKAQEGPLTRTLGLHYFSVERHKNTVIFSKIPDTNSMKVFGFSLSPAGEL